MRLRACGRSTGRIESVVVEQFVALEPGPRRVNSQPGEDGTVDPGARAYRGEVRDDDLPATV